MNIIEFYRLTTPVERVLLLDIGLCLSLLAYCLLVSFMVRRKRP